MTKAIKDREEEKPAIQISKKKQLLFTLVIFIVFIFLLEVALRLLDLPPTLKQDAGLMYKTNNAMGFEHTAGWSGYHAGAMTRINSFGFRGKEFSPVKPPGTVRILGIGDSFTLGMAVGDDDTYLARLEEMLNRDGRARYETINAGHQNMNTRQEYRYLKERDLMSLGPDVVILGFTMHNDANLDRKKDQPGRNEGRVKGGRYGKTLEKELSKASPVLSFTNSKSYENLSESYRLARILRAGVDWIYQDTITEISYRVILEQYEDGSRSWETCRSSLLGIYDICQKNNVPLIVALFPIFNRRSDQTFNEYPREALDLHSKLKAVFADKSGVTVVPIFDDLAASGLATSELRVPIDGHPNRLWHEITAKRLHSSLKDLGL
jgi:hypothetical protein